MKIDRFSHHFGNLKVNFIEVFYLYGITIMLKIFNIFFSFFNRVVFSVRHYCYNNYCRC